MGSTIENLRNTIRLKKARVAIIGMGYVGLPHAITMGKAGLSIVGVDIKKERVDLLNRGRSYIGDARSEDLKDLIRDGRFEATTDFGCLEKADIVIICVPTPLDENKIPDISYIKASAGEVKKRLHKGQLIILESTTYPGTTEEVLLPLLEETGLKAGKDFFLAFAPERIDPGNKLPLSEIPKVVGGVTPQCTSVAALFYRQFLASVHPVSSAKAAEMTKILENTYRLVNISAINEMTLLCGKMGIDIWEVIEAAKTKPYGFQAFYPSSRAGGHCIPLDPFYLSWKAREYNFWARFIELAGEINAQMPHAVVTKVIWTLNQRKKPVSGSRILLWGASYKKDISDVRESAILEIAPDLMRKGARVEYFDPLARELRLPAKSGGKPKVLRSVRHDLSRVKEYDLVLILTDHSGFDYDDLAKNANLVVDTRNAVKSRKHKNVFRL